MAKHNELGEKGEDIACEYLIQKGYKILRRNWHFSHLEIDMIARDNEEIVIVEVKSRTEDTFEQPYEAVSKKKQRSLVEAADAWLQEYEVDLETRFDVISIVFKGGGYVLQHFKDAFYPPVN